MEASPPKPTVRSPPAIRPLLVPLKLFAAPAAARPLKIAPAPSVTEPVAASTAPILPSLRNSILPSPSPVLGFSTIESHQSNPADGTVRLRFASSGAVIAVKIHVFPGVPGTEVARATGRER